MPDLCLLCRLQEGGGCGDPPPPRYTLDDLLVVMPSSHDRLSLIDASRDWRAGMKAFVLLDRPIDGINISTAFLDKKSEFQETYGYFGDMHDSRRWSQVGDARYCGLLMVHACTLRQSRHSGTSSC